MLDMYPRLPRIPTLAPLVMLVTSTADQAASLRDACTEAVRDLKPMVSDPTYLSVIFRPIRHPDPSSTACLRT